MRSQRSIMAILAVVALSATTSCRRDPDARDRATGEQIASLLALPQADGSGIYDPKQLHGKRVLVNFWSPTCGICVHELPDLQAAADSRDDVELVTVAMQTKPGRAIAAARARGIKGPVLMGNAALKRELRINQVPITMVLDGTGHARRVMIGPRSRLAFENALDSVN